MDVTHFLSGTKLNTAKDAAIGMIPFVGDGIDIWMSEEISNHMGYVDGRVCVTGHVFEDGEDGADEAVDGWEYNGKYQRFIQDDLMAAVEGDSEESSVVAFLDEYYAEHPLDNSPTGVLARYSGLPKERVELALDVIELGNFIANYDPSDLAPAPKVEEAAPAYMVESPDYFFDNYVALYNKATLERRRYVPYAG